MISVTAGSAYFDGVCYECRPSETLPGAPEPTQSVSSDETCSRGQVVTNVHVAGNYFTLCAKHTNQLIESLQKAGVRRDL